jgi:hypothetical protein
MVTRKRKYIGCLGIGVASIVLCGAIMFVMIASSPDLYCHRIENITSADGIVYALMLDNELNSRYFQSSDGGYTWQIIYENIKKGRCKQSNLRDNNIKISAGVDGTNGEANAAQRVRRQNGYF